MSRPAATALLTILLNPAVGALTDSLRVPLHGTVNVQRPGATAAYVVDATIAEVSAHDGTVRIHGRAVGSTKLVVVTLDGTESSDLIVFAPSPRAVVSLEVAASQNATIWDTAYDSATARLTTTLNGFRRAGARLIRWHVTDVTQVRGGNSGDARSRLPSASFQLIDRGHELVLIDRIVDHSPLTLQGTSLRGVHYRGGPFDLHAGYASPLPFQNVFLPTNSEAAFGGSYRVKHGRSSFVPSLYYFTSGSSSDGTGGPVTSLLYERGARADALRLRGEVAYGLELGASGEVSYDGVANRLMVSGKHQPKGFSSLETGQRSGTLFDGAWSAQVASSLRLNVSGSIRRQYLPLFEQRTATPGAELRYHLKPRWSVGGGARYGLFAGGRPVSRIQTLTIPLEMAFDGRRAGIIGQYRYQQNTATNEGGHGGRVNLRAGSSRLVASAFADYQKDAATVALVFREAPELARLFTELGLTIRTPEDVTRLLRDDAAVAALGYIEDVSISLEPSRWLSGASLVWTSSPHSKSQIALRVLNDRTQTIRRLRQTSIATLSYSRRLAGAIEVTAGATGSSHDAGSGHALRQWSVNLGARVRLDKLPSMPAFGRRGTIRGLVFRDDQASGTYTEGMPRVPHARVTLDGGAAVTTDASGSFVFSDVSLGLHSVEVALPAGVVAYFTTSSLITLNTGETREFGIAYSPARLTGSVRDDAGAGIGGVTVHLEGSGREHFVTSDSDGGFSLAVAPGDYTLALRTDSLPTGYNLAAASPRAVRLTASVPSRSEFVVGAFRSISGVVKTQDPSGVVVSLLELNRTTTSGNTGNYVFRNLKPGSYTVAVEIEGHRITRIVDVPAGPASLRGIDLERK